MTTGLRPGEAMEKSLLDAIEASDVEGASRSLAKSLNEGVDPWKIHLSLFPIAQRVLNPPFINPHLPKMYRICRELAPYLAGPKVAGLVALEVTEYARRPKMRKVRRSVPLTAPVAFQDIEVGIRENDPEKVAVLMAAFLNQKGGTELARRILLLGSGYLNNSLGHSLSCTAFILSEMVERADQEPWPALSGLADYFCKGKFYFTQGPKKSISSSRDQDLNRLMFRAVSGRGIANLHHAITRYAIERVRNWLSQEEYDHMISVWVEFMGDKGDEEVNLDDIKPESMEEYGRFYETFSKLDAKRVAASLREMISPAEGGHKLERFLVQGLCDGYRGDYNPHYLTGLGSALWVADQYRHQPAIAVNALYQYLDFFFSSLKS